jgi:DNA invertase Pin-like site-specific DNA recombinase
MTVKTVTKAIAYIRVSTAQQGRSGLGLEAQREVIARFCDAEGIDVLAEYREIETGKDHDALNKRPELKAALDHARREKADIVVAKLDRLGRDAQRTVWGRRSPTRSL